MSNSGFMEDFRAFNEAIDNLVAKGWTEDDAIAEIQSTWTFENIVDKDKALEELEEVIFGFFN